jgi:hypothetical protein
MIDAFMDQEYDDHDVSDGEAQEEAHNQEWPQGEIL